MTNYGKIVIMADSIEQAQAELDLIKEMARSGARMGMGEIEITEEIVAEMPRATECGCACRGGNCMCPCCCDDDDEDIDEYEDENFAMDSDPITRAMMRMMGI